MKHSNPYLIVTVDKSSDSLSNPQTLSHSVFMHGNGYSLEHTRAIADGMKETGYRNVRIIEPAKGGASFRHVSQYPNAGMFYDPLPGDVIHSVN